MTRAALLGLLLGLGACSPSLPPPHPPAPGADGCQAAEDRLRELRQAGDPSCADPELAPDGWGAFCRDQHAIGVDLHPACIALARTCAEVDARSRGIGC